MKLFLIATLAMSAIGCSQIALQPKPIDQVFTDPKILAEEAAQDATAYQAIASACAAKDFTGFLKIFSTTSRLRESYSSFEVAYWTGTKKQMVRADENYYYPLKSADNRWLASTNFPVTLAMTTPTPEQTIVTWQHIPLDITASWTQADLASAKEKGELSFTFVQGCWRLISDRRM